MTNIFREVRMRDDEIEGTARAAREAAPQYGNEDDAEWVTSAEFKTHCLRLIEEVRQGRGSIVVTRYGTPVARLVPYQAPAQPIFGWMSGTVLSYGDIVSPIGEPWDADT